MSTQKQQDTSLTLERILENLQACDLPPGFRAKQEQQKVLDNLQACDHE